jgi:glycosyltransferase involved in cell wall biosynthesis
MTKLSIIVPVYNVEKFIRPCFESIFKQGLDDDDFELIIANDGSTDRSMEMIEDIIVQHNNITVINQENLSLSVARNNGIAAAKGEYIFMPDSDDLLIENKLKPLLEKALETKVDLVVADFLTMTNDEIEHTNTSMLQQPTYEFTMKTGHELFLQDMNPYHCYVWRTLYRREFITSNNISFYPGIRYQDIPFTHECCFRANNCIRTNIVLNIYRIWPGSSTRAYTINNSRHFITAIALTWKLRQIEGLSSDVVYKLEENIFTSLRTMIYHTLHCVKHRKDRYALINYINFQAPDLYFTHNIRQRLTTFMIKKAPHLFINVYYLYAQIVYKKNYKKIWKKLIL